MPSPAKDGSLQVNLHYTQLRVSRVRMQLSLCQSDPRMVGEARNLLMQLDDSWNCLQADMQALRRWIAEEQSRVRGVSQEEAALRSQALMAADWPLRAGWMPLDEQGNPEGIFEPLGKRYQPQPQDQQAHLLQNRILREDRMLDEDGPLVKGSEALFAQLP